MKVILKNSNLLFKKSVSWELCTAVSSTLSNKCVSGADNYPEEGNTAGNIYTTGTGNVYVVNIPTGKTKAKLQAYNDGDTLKFRMRTFGYCFVNESGTTLLVGNASELPVQDAKFNWVTVDIPEGATQLKVSLPSETVYNYTGITYLGTYFK